MTGNTMEEIYEYLEHGHEVEFEYLNNIYMIQPNETNGKNYLDIYICEPYYERLCREYISDDFDEGVPRKVVDAVLNNRCLNGKSFMEAEAYITITVIY